MQALGFDCAELEDPYAAAAELFRRPLVYGSLVLSLASLFKEELSIIAALKRRLPRLEIWLTHIEGRQVAFAEAIRLGADGLLADDGLLHRMAPAPDARADSHADLQLPPERAVEPMTHDTGSFTPGEPVLSADELRALLEEQPLLPPSEESQ